MYVACDSWLHYREGPCHRKRVLTYCDASNHQFYHVVGQNGFLVTSHRLSCMCGVVITSGYWAITADGLLSDEVYARVHITTE